jgi:hypothetical protein
MRAERALLGPTPGAPSSPAGHRHPGDVAAHESLSPGAPIVRSLAIMRLRLPALFALLGSANVACSSNDAAPSASAEAAIISSAPIPTSSASAAAALRAPTGPRLVVLHSFPGDTAVFRLRRSLLACTDGCSTGTKDSPSKVETFIVDRAGSKKAPLFPEAACSRPHAGEPGAPGRPARRGRRTPARWWIREACWRPVGEAASAVEGDPSFGGRLGRRSLRRLVGRRRAPGLEVG